MKETLINLLGKDRTEEIKDAVRDIIIENLKEDLSSEYVIDPDSIIDFENAIMAEIKEEIKEEVKEKIKEQLLKKAMKDFNL